MQQLKYSEYPDLLSAAEQVYLPSCAEAEIEAAKYVELAELILMVNAISMIDCQHHNEHFDKVGFWLKSLFKAKSLQDHTNWNCFSSSFAVVNNTGKTHNIKFNE